MPRPYRDRLDAGQALAKVLRDYAAREDVVVLGLPRGGVPVADVVARELGVPLELILVRKVGVPGQPELAMGAVASGDVTIRHKSIIRDAQVSERQFDQVANLERLELERRRRRYLGELEPLPVFEKTAIVVDDGIATGSTMRAAIEVLRARGADKVIAAAPVAAFDSVESLKLSADSVVCPLVTDALSAISLWYREFSQVSDDTVARILTRARADGNRSI